MGCWTSSFVISVDNLLRYDPPHIDWLHSCDAMQEHQTCFVDSFIVRCGKNSMLQELVPHPHDRLQTHFSEGPLIHPILVVPISSFFSHVLHDGCQLLISDGGQGGLVGIIPHLDVEVLVDVCLRIKHSIATNNHFPLLLARAGEINIKLLHDLRVV
ncbi:hypothetical protein A2U01_0036884 [Trifolium medium]|uniref:Uncharacterized protein n=1 Tax=Trifolium medium TaxID=97028 RepID=A0A392PWQ6_9FABA|nr:hypothetical protein [Trifolium medium]